MTNSKLTKIHVGKLAAENPRDPRLVAIFARITEQNQKFGGGFNPRDLQYLSLFRAYYRGDQLIRVVGF